MAGNATVTFMLFTTQNRNQAASFSEAERIVRLPNEVLANLTAAEQRQLINFGRGAEVQNLALSVSDNAVPALRATWRFSQRATARVELFENSQIPNGQTACWGYSGRQQHPRSEHQLLVHLAKHQQLEQPETRREVLRQGDRDRCW